MPDRPPRSLVAHVLGAVVLILVLGGLLVAGSTWLNGRQAARQSYDRLLLGAASDIAGSVRVAGGEAVVDLPVSAFELLAQAPDDRIYYAVRGPGGQYITGLDPRMTIAPPQTTTRTPQYFDAPLHGEPARFVRLVRPFAEREFSGPVEITVGQTLRARDAMTAELMLDALLPMAGAGLALLVMSWIVIRSALHPLKALSADLARRDPMDLTPVDTDGLPQELGVMLGAMNRFMGRLEGQVTAMRNLISDTAHQLRTPVAAIRVQAESAASEPDGAARERALSRLLARTGSLAQLLEQLLSRALVIHRTDSAPRVPVDLREVALEIAEREDHALLSPGVEVRLEIGEDPVMVSADAFSLGEAARNLLGNAISHGQAPVVIGTARHGREAMLWVRDAGKGPDRAVAERLGERFNRSTGSSEESTGIGLSIVKSVATAFGGRVEMTSDESGFCVALVLPAEGEA